MTNGANNKLFISHSTRDDAFVRSLRGTLEQHGQDSWVDSRELRGGDPLWPDIQKAIHESSAYAVVVSPDSLQSKWVGKELQYALQIQEERGKDEQGKNKFPVVPLSLNNTKLGVLETFFHDEPIYISVSSQAGGAEQALNDILVALGKRLNADVAEQPQPVAEPLEELVLSLSNLKFADLDGTPRASGEARLVYEPAATGKRVIQSKQKWRFIAPVGPIEAEELKWYLEHYAVWPSEYFAPRARKVEDNLQIWGQKLYQAAMPSEHVSNVLVAWEGVDKSANRRFSIFIDDEIMAGAPQAQAQEARECATLLLGLPWELLYNDNDDAYLFQGAQPVRVRRRLPNTKNFPVPVVKPPIRILLITARPEDESCGYIDHRISAEPLVSAMEALGSLVELTILNPPTFAALSEELQRQPEDQQYHVVHFDGHGVYNRAIGLGGLCFENPQDVDKLTERRHDTVYTKELGPLLHQHRIPLVFLEACQTAASEDASESVASELLQRGVASVVAMSHSVLVETARRFVKVFYRKLTEGARVGEAMLAGQQALKLDGFRGHIFGAGELRLEDWFVPVLFQEKADPQLFVTTLKPQAQSDVIAALQGQLKHLPEKPKSGFIGRSRDLLALERLLQQHPYAVVQGQGGEGKTALAAEFARWLLRSRQVQRVAFVSVEQSQHVSAVLDTLGQQLLNNYSVAEFANLGEALLPVERALKEQSTLLVVDNMESILLPPYVAEATPDALSEEANSELKAILALCARLNNTGDNTSDTRIAFTSRETLPAPFDNHHYLIELHRLDRIDAVKLVERTLNLEKASGNVKAAAQADIEDLVDAVKGHARTLTLLAPSLKSLGVKVTTNKLTQLMAAMQGNREQSLFASVALSLERLSADNQQRVRALGLFHGGVQLNVLMNMMDWSEEEVASLAHELLATGLATQNPYNHLSLNTALCPYLLQQLEGPEQEALKQSWLQAMRGYARSLVQQSSQDAQVASTLTQLELPNLFALLEQVAQAGNEEATIDLCTRLYRLLKNISKPRLLTRVAQWRDAADKTLQNQGNTWSHARFEAQRMRIEQQSQGGQLPEAFKGAQQLLEQASSAGEGAYAGADYDLAMAYFLLGRMMKAGGAAERALALLTEAFTRFEAVAKEQQAKSQNSKAAARMASVCLTDFGDCLLAVGRYDEAANAYKESIQRAEKLEHRRQVAVGKIQLGTVYLMQKNYDAALDAYKEARDGFTQLGEPGSVAVVWHQTAMVYEETKQPEAAEDAYRQSLAIKVQLGNVAGQANTLLQLGNLYDDQLGRGEEAVALLRQAVDKYVEIGDLANEGLCKNNLADILHKLNRLDEARQAILRAIDCKSNFGHAAEPWKSWDILHDIESDQGNASAAANAWQKAYECYLAYRRDGGENHNGTGRLAHDITQMLLAGETSQAETLLQKIEAQMDEAGFGVFHNALQAIVAGSRDPGLAEHPDLDYDNAAELLILLETLEAAD